MNWNAVSAISSICGTIIAALLTYLIIKQTAQINLQQVELEERLNRDMQHLQRQQLLIEIFPYRREFYIKLFGIFRFNDNLARLIFNLDGIHQKSPREIFEMYEFIRKESFVDIKEVPDTLREAEFIFSKDTAKQINFIADIFDNLNVKLMGLKIYDMPMFVDVLSKEEINKSKMEILKDTSKLCQRLSDNYGKTKKMIRNEIDISNVEKEMI